MEVVEEEIKIKICFFVCESNSKHSERHQKHLNQKGRVRLHELHSPGLKHSVMAAPAESSQALLLCLFGRHNFPDLPAKGAEGAEGAAEGGAHFGVRQHNLSSSAATKEYSHFVTSLCSSPSFKREKHGTVRAIHTMRQRGARGTEGPTGKSGRLDSDLALATLELTA